MALGAWGRVALVAAGVAVLGAGMALLVPRRAKAAADPSSASVNLRTESDPVKA